MIGSEQQFLKYITIVS